MYYFIEVEKDREREYIVGVNRADGGFEIEGEYVQRSIAAERVHYLNGGISSGQLHDVIDHLIHNVLEGPLEKALNDIADALNDIADAQTVRSELLGGLNKARKAHIKKEVK